jgi:serine/threonine-protein kinase SRPK3
MLWKLLPSQSLPRIARSIASVPKISCRPPPLSMICSGLDIENVERYCPGGFHPVTTGDILGEGRYKILHKLGYGGSSMVWLARDLMPPSPMVALKILTAEASARRGQEIPEVAIPTTLLSTKHLISHFPCRIEAPLHHFIERGPNGSHLCIATTFFGPSLSSFFEVPGLRLGSRRLRGDLARKIAKQVANCVYCMHHAGYIHGGMRRNSQCSLIQKSFLSLDRSFDA